MIPHEVRPSGPTRICSVMLEKLDVQLGSLFPTGETTGPERASQCGPFSVSVVQRGASASPPGSEFFKMVSCLCVVASWCSCEGD